MRYIFLLAPFLAGTFLFSCNPGRKSAKELTRPAIPPSSIKLPDSLPTLPNSEINLVLKIYAPPILRIADSMVPKEFNSDNWPNYSQPSCDFRYKYHFLRSVLKMSCTNNQINVQFTGNYQLTGSKCLCTMEKPVSPWISGSCGYGKEPLRKVGISISSQIIILPNFKLKTVTHLDNIQSYDKCVVSMFSSDVTNLVSDSVRSSVNAFCTAMDAAINGMDYTKTLLQFYQQYKTMAISNYGYVSLNPSLIRLGNLNFSKDTFYLSAGTVCRPEFSSDSQRTITNPGFPYLNLSERNNASIIYLNFSYGFDFLSRMLNDSLKNKTFYVNGRTIVIKQASLKGIGGHRVEIKIEFAGSNRGKLYLRGSPVYDSASQTLTVPDLAYSIEDEDLVLKIAKTISRNKIKKGLSGKTYLDIGALIKSNIPALNARLNSELFNHFYSSGKINNIKVLGILAQNDQIRIQVYANVNLALSATGMP